MQDLTAFCAAPASMSQSISSQLNPLQSICSPSNDVQPADHQTNNQTDQQPGSDFLSVAPDVRLHIQTLDMLCAAAGSRIYVFDRAARYLYVSREGAAIMGLSPDAMIGSAIFDLGFSPESSRKLAADLGLVFATGQAGASENSVMTAQGLRHIAYTLHPLAGADGVANAVAVTVMDITTRIQSEAELARKQAEAETLNTRLRRAMTETHHRVKNNLQLIAAMIDMRVMQAPLSADGQPLGEDTPVCSISDMRRLSACVRTLAAVHDILTHESKQNAQSMRVSMRPLLRRLLPLMQEASDTRRIQSRLDDARLPVRHSTSLALILNELVSNALKYGRGNIEVAFTVEDEQARLSVSDDGPGFPAGFDASRASNTGLELVDSLTRLDLGGTVIYANRAEGGGRVVVTLPIPTK